MSEIGGLGIAWNGCRWTNRKARMDALSAALDSIMPFVGSIGLLVLLWLPFLVHFWRKNPNTALVPPARRRVSRPRPRAVWAPLDSPAADSAATLSAQRSPVGIDEQSAMPRAEHAIPTQRTGAPDRRQSPVV